MAATASNRLAIRFVMLVSILTPQAFYADVAVSGKTFHPGRFSEDIASTKNRGAPGPTGTIVGVKPDVTPRLQCNLQQEEDLDMLRWPEPGHAKLPRGRRCAWPPKRLRHSTHRTRIQCVAEFFPENTAPG
jgi:hypothetical protein